MEPLRWSWTVRVGPYLRATLGAQPWLWAAVPLVLVGSVLLAPREWAVGSRLLAGIVVAVLAAAVFVSAVARQLRRRQRAARGAVQTYALGPDALVLAVGQDSYRLPTAELTVATRGRDWVAVRRRAMGRRPLLLLTDDPALVAPVVAVLREHGAAEHR